MIWRMFRGSLILGNAVLKISLCLCASVVKNDCAELVSNPRKCVQN